MRDPGQLAIDPGQALRYSAETQDRAYRSGAYDFVETLEMSPRMAILAGYIRNLGLRRILDIGRGTGQLLHHLDRYVQPLRCARGLRSGSARSSFRLKQSKTKNKS